MTKWLAALLLMFATPAAATVDYSIDLTSPEHHSGKVTALFPAADSPYLDVKMAAWRTGRYTILNLANGVSGFAASDKTGSPLRWEKVDKSTWRIHLDRPTQVRVTYDLYANELGLRTRHIDDSHAFLNGSAVFVYADRFRADDVAVSLKVPRAWRSFSGMESRGDHRFVGANWDVLTDSPIETGVEQVTAFREGGRDYQVTFWGHGNFDTARVAADLKKIVAQAPSIWRSYPFRRYLFMIHATDGVGGATEHINSTIIQLPRYRFQGGGYTGFLQTAAHEFIHSWNVKAYRAAAMVPYDYQRENYTNLLWVEEGSTDYFADHFLVRAGLASPQDYFATLSSAIDANRHRPGRMVQSIADGSFDAWISPPTDGNRRENGWVDIYSEGLIASWALDIALLKQSGGKVSYRDVHRLLHERFDSRVKGFTEADILTILRELTGQPWEPWWAANIHRPVAQDFAALLAPVGLRLDSGGPVRGWAGWNGDAVEGGIKLTQVEKDGPAWKAGFVTDDILVAIDGARVSSARFEAMVAERSPGTRARIAFFRRDQLMEKTLPIGSIAARPPRVVTVPNPTPAQRALFERWLLVPYPAG